MSRIDGCRSCGSPELHSFLNLGDLPLPDALVKPEAAREADPTFPLEVALCPSCALVQIVDDVDPELMFVDNYLYFSSFSDQVLAHSRDHALGLIDSQALNDDSLVVELASNDGYLLANFVDAGVPVLGIDPAPDQAAAARGRGVRTLEKFFGIELARELRETDGPADVIIANNVMAHVPDLESFVGGMAALLADDGVITVENPSVWDLVERTAFDTIYHEHTCYYSCLSVDALMRRHGLFLNDVELFPDLHGGTNRWIIGKTQAPTERLTQRLADEREAGLSTPEFYDGFAQRVTELCESLHKQIDALRADGLTIAAYGAAAKGTIMLNAAQIDAELVPWVVDRNPHKHGLHMPGTHQLICDVDTLETGANGFPAPDVVLILAWNFAPEIMTQQQSVLDRCGRFLVPVPEPKLVP